ncbi:MAG TPA: single-stranded DNA-binding protein [Streptosporangiaceae bacterium]|nr:single-stranded DNA-binding protein [Streptosporangiaceae bacterium]
MVNEATISVSGYVATQPKGGWTRDGTRTVFMRLGWTPRRIDKATGEWRDQPSSFVSVICYRKVAENAALCLRRGDPVVVKGNLRVREYGDEDGPKRTAVEVIADTIGHDLSRGTTVFKRSTEQLEKTAAEHELEIAATTREPLPGDLGAAEPGVRQPEGDYPGPADLPSARQPDGDYSGPADPELAEGEEFDDEEARQMLADAGEAIEPLGAAT